jgi:hypothetical protein
LRKMWQKTPYGLSLPNVLNSMSRDVYEFLWRNLHFTDNYKQQPEGEGSEGYDPLFKVRYPLDIIGKGLRKVWTAGQHVTIDESMIKYCGIYACVAHQARHQSLLHLLCCLWNYACVQGLLWQQR